MILCVPYSSYCWSVSIALSLQVRRAYSACSMASLTLWRYYSYKNHFWNPQFHWLVCCIARALVLLHAREPFRWNISLQAATSVHILFHLYTQTKSYRQVAIVFYECSCLSVQFVNVRKISFHLLIPGNAFYMMTVVYIFRDFLFIMWCLFVCFSFDPNR